MSKRSVVLIILAVLGFILSIVMYLKKAEDQRRQRSDEILEEFRRVDESLKDSRFRIDSSDHHLFDSLRTKFEK
jgi:hypothetical protein